ncbi:MAG: recombinase RecT [Dehalococcoidia bacterium]|jgi:recombination protein RecT
MAGELVKRPAYEVEATRAKDAFVRVAGEDKWNREVVFALQAIRASDALQKSDPESIKNAVVNIALTGASLNPALQQAFLIPRKGKACLDFSYRGLSKIAVDSGGVVDIDATVVYENDDFYYEMGLHPVLHHVPCLGGDRGKMKYVYAVAVLPSGLRKFIVLDAKEIEKIKKVSAYGNAGPWKEWESEMWRKSAVKKLYKLLPQTDRMSTAVSLSNEAEVELRNNKKADDVVSRFVQTKPEDAIEMIECPNTMDDDGNKQSVTKSTCETCATGKEECPSWG